MKATDRKRLRDHLDYSLLRLKERYRFWEPRIKQSWRKVSGDTAGYEDRRLPWATAFLIIGIPVGIAIILTSR